MTDLSAWLSQLEAEIRQVVQLGRLSAANGDGLLALTDRVRKSINAT